MVRREIRVERHFHEPLFPEGSHVRQLQERCRCDLGRAGSNPRDSSTQLQDQQVAIGQELDARRKSHPCNQDVVLEQSTLISKERRQGKVAGRDAIAVGVGRHRTEVIGRILIQSGQCDGMTRCRRCRLIRGETVSRSRPVSHRSARRDVGCPCNHGTRQTDRHSTHVADDERGRRRGHGE